MKNESLLSIHRHWIWADRMRQHFEAARLDELQEKKLKPEDKSAWFAMPVGEYMCLAMACFLQSVRGCVITK